MGRERSGARTKEGFLANFISSLSRNLTENIYSQLEIIGKAFNCMCVPTTSS